MPKTGDGEWWKKGKHKQGIKVFLRRSCPHPPLFCMMDLIAIARFVQSSCVLAILTCWREEEEASEAYFQPDQGWNF